MHIQKSLKAALAASLLVVACAGQDPPALESATPSEGPTSGGTEVLLRGQYLSPFSVVAFGEVPAPSVRWVDWSTIAVLSPPGDEGTVDIAVRHFTDRSVLRGAFTYVADPPVVDADCFVTITPGFGADDVDVTGAITVTFTEPVDAAVASAAVSLQRLGEEVAVEVDVDVVGDTTLVLRPRESLAFFADYEVWVEGVQPTNGASVCPADGVVFSTRSPYAEPRALRPGPVYGFATIGNVGIAASASYRGLQVYDLSDPAAPVVTDEVLTEQTPLGVQIEGDRAYVPAASGGVLIFDVSTPDAPALIGVAGTPGSAIDVVPFTRGLKRYIAVADGPGGLRFIDVTQAEGAKDVSWMFPAGNPDTFVSSVDMRGTLLAVAEWKVGTFSLVDTTNVAAPTVLATRGSEAVADTFFNAYAPFDVALGETTLYVGILSYGIEAFDVADPANPAFIDHVLGPQGLCGFGCEDAIGSLVVLGDTAATETLFTSSALTGAVRVVLTGGELQAEVLPAPGRTHMVFPTAQNVWLGTERGLAVFEPAALPGTAPLYAEANGWGFQRDAVVTQGHLYTTSQSRGLEAYDLSDPTDPSLTSLAVTAGVEADMGLISVHVAGDLLLVGDGRAGLALFDTVMPAQPQLLSQGFPTDTAADMVTSTDSAFACAGNNELWYVRFSDPVNPTVDVFLIPPVVGGCHSLARLGDTLYMAGPSGLGIYDVSDETTPVYAGAVTLPAVDVLIGAAAQGDYLYLTTYVVDFEGTYGVAQRLVVFDVSDPIAPVRVWDGPDIAGVGEVEVHGDKLFLGGGKQGVWVFGLGDPAAPELEGRIEFPGVVNNLSIAEVDGTTMLYASQRGGGIGAAVLGSVPMSE